MFELEFELSMLDDEELTLLELFAGSLFTFELVFMLSEEGLTLFPLFPELLVGSFVAVEPLEELLTSRSTLLFTLALLLSFTTLPLLLDEDPSLAVLSTPAEPFTILPALDVVVGALLVLEPLSLPLPLVTILALPAPLPYPPIEPRCP